MTLWSVSQVGRLQWVSVCWGQQGHTWRAPCLHYPPTSPPNSLCLAYATPATLATLLFFKHARRTTVLGPAIFFSILPGKFFSCYFSFLLWARNDCVFYSLKQYNTHLLPQFLWVRCLGLHGLAGSSAEGGSEGVRQSRGLIWGLEFSPSSCGCRHNSPPWSCRTHGSLLLEGQQGRGAGF